jgi:hypothetical protein
MVTATIGLYQVKSNNYEPRTETYMGKKHLVVPVVMMVEGVHCGSAGPLFHSIEELGKYPASWNGIPVSIQHPEQDGQYISANSPEVLERQTVGQVFNTRTEGNKLKAECWVDIERIMSISPEAYAYLNSKRPLEVSIGVFTDDVDTEGEWNGEHYSAIATNHRPDHLALLPGGTGACSWADGAGIRINSKQKGGESLDTTQANENVVATIPNATIQQPTKYRRKDDVKVDKAKMDILVQSGVFSDADVEWLSGLETDRLDKLVTACTKTTETPEVSQKMDIPAVVQALAEQYKTPEQYLQLMPEEMRDQMASGLRLHKEQRQTAIDQIKAHAQNVFTDEELHRKSMDELTKLTKLLPIRRDYSLAGARAVNTNTSSEEVLLPIGLKMNA